MEHTESERDPIEELAEEFAERQRRGERPTIDEYVNKYPELADEIRELFPALRVMEQLKPDAADVVPQKTAPSAADQPPKLLGDYHILREVGRGGMGTVYEAEQQSLGRRVALKVLPHHLLVNEKQKKRFEQEARAAARLHHSNIVPVFGIGQHDGVYYYVMQFIHGQGLDEVLVDVLRLRDCCSGPQGAKRIKSTEHPFDEPTTKYDREPSSRAVAVQQAALSMVTGQYEAQQLLDSASSVSDDARSSAVQIGQESKSAEPASSEHGEKNRPDSAPSFSSSSLSLVDASGSTGSWSKSRWTYCRSVARLGVQAADALHYAHEQGVLHRDIKPSNLMLDAQGTLWVTDFGLAKAEDQQSLTQTGDIVGTLRYMAPEMFSGQADARSDVCALGLTLYEMLALRPAFDQTDRGRLVQQVMKGQPARLQTLDRHVPGDLATIIHKAIDHEPATRYRTAGELRDDLRRFLSDEPIKARRISLASRLGRWCKRNPVIALLTGTVAALLLVGAIVSSAAAYRFRMLAHELGDKKAEAEQARDDATASQEESLRNLWQAYRSQARASRWSGRSGQRLDSLEALAKATELVPRLGLGDEKTMELRNEAIACMALADLRVVKQWEGRLRADVGVDFSPDLQSYARPDSEGNIIIRRVSDDQEIKLPVVGKPCSLRFSPDGRFLAARCAKKNGYELTLWDLENRKAGFSVPIGPGDWPVAFSPDSQRLAVDGPDGSIGIYEVATGKESTQIPATSPTHIRFHPDGRRLGVSREIGQTVEIWDLETGSVLRSFPHPKEVRGISWGADGRLLAVACYTSIYLWEADSSTQPTVLEYKSMVHHVAFHPKQNLLLSHAWDGTTQVWSLADGSLLLSADGFFLRFDPEGRFLAFRNGLQIGLWEVAGKAVCQMPCGGEDPEFINAVAISPNGRLLASGVASGGGGVRLWDLATYREVAELATGTTLSLRFDPRDGSLITSSQRGLHRWPIKRLGQPASDQLAIGPPVPLRLPTGSVPNSMDITPDGSILVVDDTEDRAHVIHPALDKTTTLGRGSPNRAYIATSPDAKWVSRGNYQGSGVDVWNGPTGKLLRSLPVNGTATAAFSPDGQWLVTAGTEYQFWKTGSWQPKRTIQGIEGLGGRMAFTVDGNVLAIKVSRNLVRLIKSRTGRVLADLEATPKHSWVQGICFNSDGSQLATACGNDGIRVWDLRRIRRQLAAMNLDWDMPPYQPSVQVADLGPLEVKVDLGPLAGAVHRERSQNHAKSGQWQKAIEEATKAIELHDADVEALGLRAKAHIALKQYDQAIVDYTKILELDPRDSSARERRAYVHAQLEQWDDALVDYTEYVRLRPDDATGWFCRGLIYRKLGRPNSALADFDESIRLDPKRYNSWHLRGHVHEALKQWDEALSDLSKAIELKPESAEFRHCRGVVRARQSQWGAAAEDFEKAIDLRPNTIARDWYELALVQLAAGNTGGYQQACAELLKRFGKTTDPNAATFVAWTCVLGPTSGADWSVVTALAERATKPAAGDRSLARIALGAALHRAGRLDEAVAQLMDTDRQIREAESTSSSCPAYAWFFLAMTQHELDAQEEARQWYEKAVQWKKQYLEAEAQDDDVTVPWTRQATLELLEKEARDLAR